MYRLYSIGLFGYINEYENFGTVNVSINCNYISCLINSNTNKDAIAGYVEISGNSTISINAYNYWVPETTGLTSNQYGTMKNIDKMFTKSEFTNFNFDSIWTIQEGVTMPYLRGLTKLNGVNKSNINY